MTTIIAFTVAIITLWHHHRRSTERHDRIVEAWCVALRLVEGRRPAPGPRALGPKTKRPAPRRRAR